MSQDAQDAGSFDKAGQAEIEGRTRAPTAGRRRPDTLPAGPHAEDALTNSEATPGAGSLPSPTSDDEAAAGTG